MSTQDQMDNVSDIFSDTNSNLNTVLNKQKPDLKGAIGGSQSEQTDEEQEGEADTESFFIFNPTDDPTLKQSKSKAKTKSQINRVRPRAVTYGEGDPDRMYNEMSSPTALPLQKI